MIQDQTLVVYVDQGEDFNAQIYWRDQYGSAITYTDPVAATVIDSMGSKVLQFQTVTTADLDVANSAVIYTTPEHGLFQFSIPASITRTIPAGSYSFDLFANAIAPGVPYESMQQYKKVVTGSMVVMSRITKIEEVGE